jgi:hypothetical protein
MQAGYAHHGRHGCQACALATHDWTHLPNEPALLNEPIARTTNAGASERACSFRPLAPAAATRCKGFLSPNLALSPRGHALRLVIGGLSLLAAASARRSSSSERWSHGFA